MRDLAARASATLIAPPRSRSNRGAAVTQLKLLRSVATASLRFTTPSLVVSAYWERTLQSKSPAMFSLMVPAPIEME